MLSIGRTGSRRMDGRDAPARIATPRWCRPDLRHRSAQTSHVRADSDCRRADTHLGPLRPTRCDEGSTHDTWDTPRWAPAEGHPAAVGIAPSRLRFVTALLKPGADGPKCH